MNQRKLIGLVPPDALHVDSPHIGYRVYGSEDKVACKRKWLAWKQLVSVLIVSSSGGLEHP
jgi:hypothetical protein